MSGKTANRERMPPLIRGSQFFKYIIIIWTIFYALIWVSPTFSNLFSFLDHFTFPGISLQANCISGDPVSNSRSLMLAWVLGSSPIFLWKKTGSPMKVYVRLIRYQQWLIGRNNYKKRAIILLSINNTLGVALFLYGLYLFSFATGQCFGDNYFAKTVLFQGVTIIFSICIILIYVKATYGRILFCLKCLNKRRG